jgi:DNA-binding XRE family transcriptional regulator
MSWAELRAEGERLGMPLSAVEAFRSHRSGARRRGLLFLFTLGEWWAWWQADGRWSRRGLGKDALVMARRGDAGPYHPSNVFPATHSVNVSEAVRRPRRERVRANLPLDPRVAARRPLGTNIRKYRVQLGMSRRALAQAAGMAYSAVSDMEAGRCNPTLNALCAVADVLGKPPSALTVGVTRHEVRD